MQREGGDGSAGVTVSPRLSLAAWGPICAPPRSQIDPFSLFSLQVFGPSCPHRRGTILHPSVSPSAGGDTPSGVFGDRGCTSTSRTERTRWGSWERTPGSGEGVAGLRSCLSFPISGRGRCSPPRGHRGAARPHIALVPSWVTPPDVKPLIYRAPDVPPVPPQVLLAPPTTSGSLALGTFG